MHSRRYFPGLNALRAYAALSVVAHHMIAWSTLDVSPLRFLFLDGSDAVTLFFVLSGFLIGYRLLDERTQTGTIDLKGFYSRRARRILPLYFGVIVVTLIVLPGSVPDGGLFLALTFTPDLNMTVLGALGIYWSLGVEEKFYLFAPILLRRMSVPALALAVLLIRALLIALFGHTYLGGILASYWRFDAMMLGVFGAWLVASEHPALQWVYRLEIPALLALTPIILFSSLHYVYALDLLIAALCGIVIVCTATKLRPVIRIQHGWIDQIGQVSYGVYLLHTMFIAFANTIPLKSFAVFPPVPGALLYVAVYFGVAVGGTILAAYLSYRYFERPFLRLKDRHRSRPAPSLSIAAD